MTGPQLHVLHALRLRGLANAESVAAMTGRAVTEVADLLTVAAGAGLVKERTGRMSGFTLTPDGRAAHAAGIADDLGADERQHVAKGYAAFVPLNSAFKQLCTDWQLRTPDEPNDHSDADYDGAVIGRLAALHVEIAPVVAEVASRAGRFGTYEPRFAAALRRVQDGDVTAFARPLADSYHDVWMELHEDLLVSLGRKRDEADGH